MRFDREAVPGFIDNQSFTRTDGIEVLSPSGAVSLLPYADVKAICFVKDLEDLPHWKEHRLFASRPKTEGLWVRFRFRDGDEMDGILPNNLLALDARGFTVAPPEPTFQNQRIFIPKAAISEVKVLGVVGTPIRQPRRPKPPAEGQLEMFDQ